MADKWIGKATEKMKEKGTIGSFSGAAKKQGMSTMAFARKEKNAGGKMGKKANFAINVAKAKH